jgi:hypothetical protein
MPLINTFIHYEGRIMKLKSLALLESSLDQHDFSSFTNAISNEDHKQQLNSFIYLISKFGKIESIDVDEDFISVYLTKGTLDLSIDITLGRNESIEVEMFLIVNENLRAVKTEIHAQNINHFSVWTSTFDITEHEDRVTKLFHHTRNFTEWYMELSTEYGNVKLVNTNVDIRNGQTLSDRRIWVPYLGFFSTNQTLIV